jgi:hypothetical protein
MADLTVSLDDGRGELTYARLFTLQARAYLDGGGGEGARR